MTRPDPRTHLEWMRVQEKRLALLERRAQGKGGGGGGVGTPGPPGEDGKPGLIWRGLWDTAIAYEIGDAVAYAGTNGIVSSYIAVTAGSAHIPPEGASDAFWQMLAQEGAPGPKGDPGAPGTGGDGGGSSGVVGQITAWPSDTIPSGFLLCDGRAVSRTTYPALFAVLGSTYGAGDGSTTFNVPDIRGRVVVGKDAAQSEFNVLNENGGAKTHTLTVAELPSHNHTQNSHTHTQASHNHTQAAHSHGPSNAAYRFGMYESGSEESVGEIAGSGWIMLQSATAVGLSGATANATATNNAATATNNATTATNNVTGGGGAHNNLQPYVVTNYIIQALPTAGGSGGGGGACPMASGFILITPSAANTPTSVVISFPPGLFTEPPVVQVTPSTGAPGTIVLGVGATAVTTTSATLWLTRTNTTATTVYWTATANGVCSGGGGAEDDTGWIDVALDPAWVNFGSSYPPLQIRRVGDDIRLRGMVKPVAVLTGATSYLIATVPDGFRPLFSEILSAVQGGMKRATGAASTGTAHTHPMDFVSLPVRIQINANGNLSFYVGLTTDSFDASDYVSLSGVGWTQT